MTTISNPKSVSEVLEAAAKLIEPEGAWTRLALARNARGQVALPEDEGAVCFCGYGAVIRAAGITTDQPNHYGWELLDQAVHEIADSFPDWQDEEVRTQTEVVAKLREAAALAREQGL